MADVFIGRKTSELIEEKRELIDAIKAECGHLVEGVEWPIIDDIYWLRYACSYGEDVEKAATAIETAMNYRRENPDLFERARTGVKTPLEEFLFQFNIQAFHGHTKLGGPVLIMRNGMVDFKSLMAVMDKEDMVVWTMTQRERGFMECDKVTRETGVLVKMLVIQDMMCSGFQMPDRKMMSGIGEASKLSEKMYPQLLSTMVILNAPTWLRWAMKLFAPFMSAKTMAKFKICSGTLLDENMISDCPFANKQLNAADMPTFCGGKCDCEGGCIPGLPNDLKKQRKVPNSVVKEFIKRRDSGDK